MADPDGRHPARRLPAGRRSASAAFSRRCARPRCWGLTPYPLGRALLTLPFNLKDPGLFTFVINASFAQMVSGLIRGFDVTGFWPAVLGSVVISAVSWALNTFIRERSAGVLGDAAGRRRHHRPGRQGK
ncbi:MAG: phage holin family protein [Desulfobacterales bacterium]|nr:phage holin family protein [Desulfobacterales bacterium]